MRAYSEKQVECFSGEKKLRGMMTLPVDTENLPIVLLFHGFCINRDEQGEIYKRLAIRLSEQGIATVRFDFAGTGESDGVFSDMTIQTELSDAEAILDYVRNLEFIDRSRVGVLGMSMGGVVASLLAGKHPQDIRSLCLWSPAACLTDDAKNGNVRGLHFDPKNIPEVITFADGITIGKAYVEEAIKLDVYEEAAKYEGTVLLLQGDCDPIVGKNYAERYMDIYKKGHMKWIHGAGHGFFGEEEKQINQLTAEYFAQTLQYYKIFEPLKVGNILLKNRIVAAPITKYGDLSSPADELETIAAKARGGAGLIILGSCAVNDDNSLIYFEGSSLDGHKRPLYNEEISIIHQYGAKVSVQLLHCGMWADLRGQEGVNPVGPDTYDRVGNYQGLNGIEHNQIMDGRTIHGLTREEMEEICQQYAHAAVTAKRMGIDMVMLHFAHGWLPAEFMSPFFNHRTDEFGGSFENRIRFPMMIVDAVRKAVGPNYPLDMRIGAEEYVEGGLQVEEVAEFIKRVEDKIDLVHVSSGLDKFVEQTTYIESPSLYPHQLNVRFAEKVKEKVRIPVVTVGGITMPDEAEAILETGKADMIALGRAFIADPEWVNKAAHGMRGEINPCLRCCSCYGVATDGISQGCAVNPESGRALRLQTEAKLQKEQEKLYTVGQSQKKRVVVIGGGPAGMKAAVTASEQGNEVILFEKNNTLGGILNISEKDINKRDMKQFRDHLIYQVLHSDIQLKLGCEADKETVRKLQPDKIIVSVGADFVKPRITGIEKKHVMDVATAHNYNEFGENLVIIGAGQSGCELAISLAEEGHSVTIIEQTDQIAGAGNLIYRGAIGILFKQYEKITCMTECSCIEIKDTEVIVETKTAGRSVIPADQVIYSVGMRPKQEIAESFLISGCEVRMAGDCVMARRINEAVHEGYFAAL